MDCICIVIFITCDQHLMGFLKMKINDCFSFEGHDVLKRPLELCFGDLKIKDGICIRPCLVSWNAISERKLIVVTLFHIFALFLYSTVEPIYWKQYVFFETLQKDKKISYSRTLENLYLKKTPSVIWTDLQQCSGKWSSPGNTWNYGSLQLLDLEHYPEVHMEVAL